MFTSLKIFSAQSGGKVHEPDRVIVFCFSGVSVGIEKIHGRVWTLGFGPL